MKDGVVYEGLCTFVDTHSVKLFCPNFCNPSDPSTFIFALPLIEKNKDFPKVGFSCSFFQDNGVCFFYEGVTGRRAFINTPVLGSIIIVVIRAALTSFVSFFTLQFLRKRFPNSNLDEDI